MEKIKVATILALLRNPNWNFLTPAERQGKIELEIRYLERRDDDKTNVVRA